jgi:DUF1680 family protein
MEMRLLLRLLLFLLTAVAHSALSETSRYNAGHLIEAALAHHTHYHNDLLLAPIIKYVSLLYRLFGLRPDQKRGYPGHPEIELALLRLYNVTQDPRHLELSRFFIEERGNPKGEQGRHYFDVEADCRGEGKNEVPDYYPKRRSYWWGALQIGNYPFGRS